MANLEFRENRLFWESCDLTQLAGRFQTPTYFYSRRRIEANYSKLNQAFAEIPRLICYSVKANSNLTILSLLAGMGTGFDVVSGGELARVRHVGVQPNRVVFSGVGKTTEEIDQALQFGILMLNVESHGELECIEQRAQAVGKTAPIAIRINPDVEADTHPYVATGRVEHKFGIPTGEARELYRRAEASPHLRVRGVACHIGSQILETRPFLAAFREIHRIANDLRHNGIEVEYLDLGGGFGIRYNREQPIKLDDLAAGLAQKLRGSGYRLILEPGRSLVGNAGILLTRVLYVKRKKPKSFVVLDAGMSDLLRPALYGSYHEILPVERRPGERFRADVVGPLCETGDFLAQDRIVEAIVPGDLLAILTAGAYGYVLASNYNSRPRPAEVLLEAGQASLIRPRESVEDLLRDEKDSLPSLKPVH